MPTRRRLQQYAIALSVISVFYNTAEGVLSLVFGAEDDSRALVFYGLQSAVEVIAALLVVWRFIGVVKPGDEGAGAGEEGTSQPPRIIRIERIATITIGTLLILLALTALATSTAALVADAPSHTGPTTALPALLISASATLCMVFLYLANRTLARALNSSALHGQALCALECMQLSLVLLIGSVIYKVWKGGWWVDKATAIVIGLMFGWEGVKMVRWARSSEFDGGCCGGCRNKEESAGAAPGCGTSAVSEKANGANEPEQKQSACPPSTQCCGGCSKEKTSGEQAC